MPKKETTQPRVIAYFDGWIYAELPSLEFALENLQKLIKPRDRIDRPYLFPITIVEK